MTDIPNVVVKNIIAAPCVVVYLAVAEQRFAFGTCVRLSLFYGIRPELRSIGGVISGRFDILRRVKTETVNTAVNCFTQHIVNHRLDLGVAGIQIGQV